jgi:hypothetical protein
LIGLVLAVLAIDADIASGRRGMPGMVRTAWLAGVSETTVTNAFRKAVTLKWAVKTVAGGACSLVERRETGRSQNRAVYDLRPPHKSRFDHRPFLGSAAALVVQLLARAQMLVDDLRGELIAAQGAADAAATAAADAAAAVAACTAEDLALQADLAGAGSLAQPGQTPAESAMAGATAAWAQQAAQAAEQALRLRGLANARRTPTTPPTVFGAAWRSAEAGDHTTARTVEKAAEQAIRLGLICDPPRGSKGESFTSCPYWGLQLTSEKTRNLLDGQQQPLRGRGAGQELNCRPSGASTEGVPTGAHSASRPRTLQGVYATEQRKRRPARWSWWAYPLAVRLVRRLDFLAAGDVTAAQVAGVLGPRLSPDWTDDDVVQLIERYARIRSLLGQGESFAPLSYLASLLDRALTNPEAYLPPRSPVRDRMNREVAERRRAQVRAQSAVLQDQLAARDEAAAAERAGTGAGRAAARAAAAAAAHRRAPQADGWPAVAQPGCGSRKN